MHPCRNRSITVLYCLNSPIHSCSQEIISFCLQVALYLQKFCHAQMHFSQFSHNIWRHRSYGRYIPALGLTYQLPQQTVIIRITSQGVFTKCSSFQISDLIVTVKFDHFWAIFQLDHPFACKNIKCYSHIQIIH